MLSVVTGASGHLGANLVRRLISRGWKVRAIVHCNTRALEGLDVEQVTGDVLDQGSLKKAFSGADVVFHLAARISIVNCDRKQVEAINITGVKNVVAACLATEVKRLVHTSSFHALKQEPLSETLDESRCLIDSGNIPSYNHSKAEGERIVRQAIAHGLNAVIVMPTGMIGPYDFQPSHFGAVLLAMARGKLPVIVDAGLNWVDIRDVAEGMIRACELAKGGEKYILGGHWASIKDIARQVSRVTGQRPAGISLPFWIAETSAKFVAALDRFRGKRPLFTPIAVKELKSNRNISHAKAARELGYNPRPFQNTIADTMGWFQDNGFL